MALHPCRECKREISDQAEKCPHCGVPSPATAPPAAVTPAPNAGAGATMGCVILLVATVAVFAMCYSAYEEGAASSTSSPVLGPGTLKAGYAVCMSKPAMERAVELSDDRLAFAKYIADPSNACTLTRAGVAVTVDDYSWGLVRIRPAGDPTQAWTVQEAVAR